LGGAAVGTLAIGGAYEYNADRQMGKLEENLRNDRISRQEYESRKKANRGWLYHLLAVPHPGGFVIKRTAKPEADN